MWLFATTMAQFLSGRSPYSCAKGRKEAYSVKLSSDLPQDSPACFPVVASMQISRHHDGMAAGKKVDFGGSLSNLALHTFTARDKPRRLLIFLSNNQQDRDLWWEALWECLSSIPVSRVTSYCFMTSMQLEVMGIFFPMVPVCLGCPRLVYS
jgi:hypothetical protein